MKLYRINITPNQHSGEGENHNEWFGSLAAAKTRRRELIKDPDYTFCGCNYSLDRVEIPHLPKKKLLLRALNSKGFFPSDEIIPEAKAKLES